MGVFLRFFEYKTLDLYVRMREYTEIIFSTNFCEWENDKLLIYFR